jgi:hypothetical protein
MAGRASLTGRSSRMLTEIYEAPWVPRGVRTGHHRVVRDPERLLWVPGQKTFFPPSAPTLLTVDWITREVLVPMQNRLVFRRWSTGSTTRCGRGRQ